LEVNDSIIYAVERHASNEMFQRLSNTLEFVQTRVQQATPRVVHWACTSFDWRAASL
jgi:hypothetical protein